MLNRHLYLITILLISIVCSSCKYFENKKEPTETIIKWVKCYNNNIDKCSDLFIYENKSKLLKTSHKIRREYGKIYDFNLTNWDIWNTSRINDIKFSKSGKFAKYIFTIKFKEKTKTVKFMLFKDLTGTIDEIFEITSIQL